MSHVSEYLLRDRRSLARVREDTEGKIDELNERIKIWTEASLHNYPSDTNAALGMAIDNASDEIDRLEGRLDLLDEELGWRRSDDPGRPIVL